MIILCTAPALVQVSLFTFSRVPLSCACREGILLYQYQYLCCALAWIELELGESEQCNRIRADAEENMVLVSAAVKIDSSKTYGTDIIPGSTS